jgi:predicted metal-dependent hydrolase
MIAYTHKTHPRSKSIKIRIEPSGEVIVTTPRFTPKWSINAVVKKSDNWIQRQLLKIKQQKNFGETTHTIRLFGKIYRKKIQLQTNQPIGAKIIEDELSINPIENNPEKISNEINRFLKSTAQRYVLPRAKQLATKMKIKFNRISLRQQKTRWGSCSNQGNLNFNWRLVHCPAKVIDYVIIHELAHRQHMNHSSAFWNLVKKYDPEYLKHRGWLKRHGLTLG